MAERSKLTTKEKLLETATELFRRHGYVATSVDEICAGAGVTKGAFFHHFTSKEELAQACLKRWDQWMSAREAVAPFQSRPSPRERVIGYMDTYIGMLSNPQLLKSCLAGTTVQEVSESIPSLREAANACFVNAEHRFQALLDEAFQNARAKPNTFSLARLWAATLQGTLILAKASRDESVIRESLEHVKQYIAAQLPAE